MITNITKNRTGTVSFDATFPGQRKPQDFIVYPIHGGEPADSVTVQSDKRIGQICLETGWVTLTPSHPGGAYFHHLAGAYKLVKLNAEDLFSLKAQIFATAHGRAGANGYVFTDNSGAIDVFQGATA